MADYSYERRIVCFIDILAFSNRIKQTAKNSVVAEQLLSSTCEALYQLDVYRAIMEQDSDIKGIQITQFSDSIVISFPWQIDNGDLYVAMEALRYIQATMLKIYGILLRGGVVIGDLIHTDKLLVGPAMIAAYEVESKCAFSPRIVLDPKVAYRFDKIKNEKLKPGTANEHIIHKDLDDTSYIDYFNIDKDEIFSDEERLDYFKQLCKMIAENVNSSDMSVRMKYLWMRNKLKGSLMFKLPEFRQAYKDIVTDKKK